MKLQRPPSVSRHDFHLQNSCPLHPFFKKRYNVIIPSGGSLMVPEFYRGNAFGKFIKLATVQSQNPDTDQNMKKYSNPRSQTFVWHSSHLPAHAATPVFSSITLHLTTVGTEWAANQCSLYDAYILPNYHYSHQICGPILSVLFLCFQTVLVYRVQEGSSSCTAQSVVGFNCRLDDDPVIETA